MNKEIIFTQEWIEKAVREVLNKSDGIICESDIEKIKYLRIGESFDNDFIVEFSLEEPPIPFADTDGGEEWAFACVKNDDISRFIDERRNNKQLYTFKFNFEKEELRKYALSKVASQKWDDYKTSIVKSNYYEEIEDDDEWEAWYDETAENLANELTLFTAVKVLRINGLKFMNYKFFEEFQQLEVLELVETCFENPDEIDELKRLNQLCCWLD